MKTYYFLIAGTISLIFAGFFIVSAQNEDPFADLVYPISELGNCKNKDDCMAFCDKSENMRACVSFAEKNNLLPEQDIQLAKRMLEVGETSGPGGCEGQARCAAYCDEIDNIEECIAFAEEHNLLSEEEIAEGKKVIGAIKQGLTPPACKSKKECDSFCRLPENMEECINFGEAAGLIPPEELNEAKMVLEAIKRGVKPPPCGGKKQCDAYCAEPEHVEECVNFAEAAGFMSSEEAAMVKKTGGKGPGGCRGKEQCESFCEEPANAEACINFAVEMGMMAPEEAEQAKKMMAAGLKGGPGGCKGKEECESYCNDLSHTEECIDFSVKAGFMAPEEAEQAKKMMQSGFSTGPGGCKGRDECESYCNEPSHMEECIQFGQQQGMMSPEEAQNAEQGRMMMQQGGPGGCRGAEECRAYCDDSSHLEECANFASQQGLISQEEMEQMREQMQQMPGQGMPPGIVPSEGMRPGEGPFEGGPFEPGQVPGERFAPPEGMMPPEGFSPGEGYGPAPGFSPLPGEFTQPPTQEQLQQYQEQYQQQMEQQYQQQYQQQMEQTMPPPGTEPEPAPEIIPPSSSPSPEAIQSLFEKVKNFLASAISILKTK